MVLATLVKAQDIFFTQKFNVNTYLNPALAGNMDKLNRLSFVYRDQWRSVPVPFVSSFIGYDRKFWSSNNNMISGGVNFYFDKVGDGNLNTYIPNVQLAYTRFVNDEKQAFSWGAEVGYNIRTIQSGFVFDNQFTGDDSQFENISNGVSALRLGFGFNFKTKMGEKSFWNFGASFYNPHQPNMSFTGFSEDKRPVRYLASVSSELFINDKWSVSPFFAYQRQQKVNEIESAGIFNYYTAIGKTDMKVSAGAGYRNKDAPIVYGGVKVKDFQVGVSYDINTSPFSVATSKRGAGEVTLNYEFGKKKEREIEFYELEVYEAVDSTLEEEIVEEQDTVKESIIEEQPVTESDLEPITPINPVIEWQTKIDAQPIAKLFFFNDEPNPKSLQTNTSVSYQQSFESYLTQKEIFNNNIGEEETDKLFEQVENSYNEVLELLISIQQALESGVKIKIDLSGFASPLASVSYNNNLTIRRLQSVKLLFETYNEGAFAKHIQEGNLLFEFNPFGKSKAPEYVNGSLSNTKLSIYSPAASYERRVEIKISTLK
jgi:type IX secretion system PorP/SprF family membrane protein